VLISPSPPGGCVGVGNGIGHRTHRGHRGGIGQCYRAYQSYDSYARWGLYGQTFGRWAPRVHFSTYEQFFGTLEQAGEHRSTY
jgi:hypothetical protein